MGWPSAEIAVRGAEAALEIVFHRELAKAEDRDAKRNELIQPYRQTFSTPYGAAGDRLMDDLIEPAATRGYRAEVLETLATKHGLIPLRAAFGVYRRTIRL